MDIDFAAPKTLHAYLILEVLGGGTSNNFLVDFSHAGSLIFEKGTYF